MALDELRKKVVDAKAKSFALSADEAEELALSRELALENARIEREERDKKELAIGRMLEVCKVKFSNDVVEAHDLGNAGQVILRSNAEAYDAWNKSAKDDEAKRVLLWASVCGSVPDKETFRDNVYVRFKATLDSTLAIIHRLNGLAVDNTFLKSLANMR